MKFSLKKTVFVAGVFALAASGFSFDNENYKPRGNVNEYTRTEFTVTTKFGDYYRAPKVSYVHKFQMGVETEAYEVTNKGAIVDKITFGYDATGNLGSRTCIDADGNLSWKTVTIYDAAGNKTEENEYNANGVLTSKIIFKYNAATRQKEEAFYNGDGDLLGKTISVCDESGKVTEFNSYNAEGNLDEKEVHEYNAAGILVEKTVFNGDGIQVKKIFYKLDTNGVLGEVQVFNELNKLSERTIYKYDATGNLTRVTIYQVSEKFGSTVNELVGISEYSYRTDGSSSLAPIAAPTTTKAVAPTPSVPATSF